MVKHIKATFDEFYKKFNYYYKLMLTEREKYYNMRLFNLGEKLVFSNDPFVVSYITSLVARRKDYIDTSNEKCALAMTWEYFVRKEGKPTAVKPKKTNQIGLDFYLE